MTHRPVPGASATVATSGLPGGATSGAATSSAAAPTSATPASATPGATPSATTTPGAAGSWASTPLWDAPTASGPLDVRVVVPGSKSLSARALVLAAQASGPSRLRGLLRCRDTELMIAALSQLSVEVRWEGPDCLVTPPDRLRIPEGGARIDVGLAGTVMRFLPALIAGAAPADAASASSVPAGTLHDVSPAADSASAAPADSAGPAASLVHAHRSAVTIDGDAAARRRPVAPLLAALRGIGVRIEELGEPGMLPVRVWPGVMGSDADTSTPLGLQVDASASSQFLSALLLAAPSLSRTGCQIVATGPVPSLPHVEMTVECLRQWGVQVEADPQLRVWRVLPGRPRGGTVTIEPDLSNAGPFLCAALVAGGRVRVPAWPEHTTQAGDAWRELLTTMGGHVSWEAGMLTVEAGAALHGIDVDLHDVGELAPTVAALALVAAHRGESSRLRGIAHIRGHETDRLAAIAQVAQTLGGRVTELPDGLEIHPARLHGGVAQSFEDHRMATFAAIVGLEVPGVRVVNVETTAKTLPDFARMWSDMLDSSPVATGVPAAESATGTRTATPPAADAVTNTAASPMEDNR